MSSSSQAGALSPRDHLFSEFPWSAGSERATAAGEAPRLPPRTSRSRAACGRIPPAAGGYGPRSRHAARRRTALLEKTLGGAAWTCGSGWVTVARQGFTGGEGLGTTGLEKLRGGGGKFRPLGLPALEDKIVAKAVGMLLESITEQDFTDFSYGFRPGRSPHQALQEVRQGLLGSRMGQVIDCDISSFFDQ